MKYRTLGRTGLSVSEVGFGGAGIGHVWGQTTDEECMKAVHFPPLPGAVSVEGAGYGGDTAASFPWDQRRQPAGIGARAGNGVGRHGTS